MSALASCSLCVIFLIIDVNRCYINAILSFSASKDIFRKVVILRSHEITRYGTVSLPFYYYTIMSVMELTDLRAIRLESSINTP